MGAVVDLPLIFAVVWGLQMGSRVRGFNNPSSWREDVCDRDKSVQGGCKAGVEIYGGELVCLDVLVWPRIFV